MKIIIVEDYFPTRALLTKFLQEEGYQVESASNGKVGWQMLTADTSFDLILCDLLMPHMGGLELITKVQVLCPEIAIFVITGAENSTFHFQAMELLGHERVFVKPFDVFHLLERIQTIEEQSS